MKSCYWCEIAGEESLHPDDERGGIDADTGKWICNDCIDSAWEVNSPTPDAPDLGESSESENESNPAPKRVI